MLVAVLALAVLALFATRLEKKSIDLPVPASGPAAANPWYGVEQLLDRMNVATTSLPGLRDLPPADQPILLFARGQTGSQTDRLLAWVQGGGHLILVVDPRALDDMDEVEGKTVGGSEDPLASAAGLRKILPGTSGVSTGLDIEPPQGPPTLSIDRPDYRLYLQPGTTVLWPAQTDADAGPLGSRTEPMARVAVGLGWITLLSSAEIFDNDHIGQRDHAMLLWSLVQRGGAPVSALIVFRDQPPTIWSLLWANAWTVVIGAGVLLVVWLWSATGRFGPLLPEPAASRRSLVEHIAATGAYLWEHERHLVLLNSARRAALSRLGLDPRAPPGQAVIEAVAHETGATADEVREALHGGGPHEPTVFLRAVRALERLRRAANPQQGKA